MRRLSSILFLLSLAFGYALGLVFAIGLSARLDWPWQPLAGRSGLEVGLLDSLPHALAVIAVATVVGLVLVLRFRDTAPKLALIIALPAALNVLMAMRPGLDLRALLVLKSLLLIAVAPAAIAVLLSRLSGPRAQPSGGAVSG